MENKIVPKKNKILVGEDDKNYANIFRLKLEKEGYVVFLASNGREVLEIAKQKDPQLILLDIIMPIQNGFDTLKILKSDPDLLHIPVIMVSNLGQDEDVSKAKKLGASDYLIKANISIQEMIERVKKYIR
ncbi:MAG: response regulator [Patescibacteria group bacterium]